MYIFSVNLAHDHLNKHLNEPIWSVVVGAVNVFLSCIVLLTRFFASRSISHFYSVLVMVFLTQKIYYWRNILNSFQKYWKYITKRSVNIHRIDCNIENGQLIKVELERHLVGFTISKNIAVHNIIRYRHHFIAFLLHKHQTHTTKRFCYFFSLNFSTDLNSVYLCRIKRILL